LDYQRGAFRRVSYVCRAHPAGIDISAQSTGPFGTWWSSAELVVHAVPRAPSSVLDAQGASLRYDYDAKLRRALVHLPGSSADWSVRLVF
jgi:hypothetical protein